MNNRINSVRRNQLDCDVFLVALVRTPRQEHGTHPAHRDTPFNQVRAYSSADLWDADGGFARSLVRFQ